MSEAFLKVVNMSISAGWLVLAVLALRLILKKAPKWVNVLLWGVVAVRLICPFSIESALSLIPSRETISPEIMMDWTPEISTGIAPLDQAVNPVISASFAPSPGASANPLQILIPVAANLWLLGVLILLAYTAISYLSLRRKLNTAVILRDNIFQCETVSSPFVLGILKPRIYLPYAMDGQNLHHVVAHEQAHIRRKDHWWKPLGFLLLTVHWFNPLMWVAYILLCRDIELACDEKVIAELGNDQRADYTQALVACAVNRRMIAACPLAFGEVGVKDRIKSIMNYRKPTFWIIVTALVVCLVVAVCFLTDPVIDESDGSLLNYKNAISILTDTGEMLAIYCPSSDAGSGASIQIGNVSGADLVKQLDKWSWKVCDPPRESLPSPGSVEFVISEDYRITVHQRKSGSLRQYAVVRYREDTRYYRIGRNDYPDAVALVHAPARQSATFRARIVEIHDGYFLVEPVEGSWELNSAGKIEVPMKNMASSPEPQVGDILEIEYDGQLQETYPARLSKVYSIKVAEETSRLSLNDVIILSQKGYDLSWRDFEQFRYNVTGSGLYIRAYEINELFELWIGGAGPYGDALFPDSEPMYIYLKSRNGTDDKIDIRDGGVSEFIEAHHNDTPAGSSVEMVPTDTKLTGLQVGALLLPIDGDIYRYLLTDNTGEGVTADNLIYEFKEPDLNRTIEWEVYSLKEYPDLSVVLILSKDEGSWLCTYSPPGRCSDTALSDAINAGYVVMEEGVATHGQDVWKSFYEDAQKGKAASVIVAHYQTLDPKRCDTAYFEAFNQDYPSLSLYHLIFDGTTYTLSFTVSGLEYTRTYEYLMKYEASGTPLVGNTEHKRIVHYALTHDTTHSWEELWGSIASSAYPAAIDFYTIYAEQ